MINSAGNPDFSATLRLTSDVLIALWFDTEDFINSVSDDIPSKICDIMERHDVKVTFKIVGEKLRALKANGRSDVIEAMGRHDIGFHGNLHSVHPTISEYVGNSDWDEGVAEFFKNENPGVEELRSTYGRDPSCYGQPSYCWVPEAYPSLLRWNIGVYLDETNSIAPLNGRPYYYCNTLNIMGLGKKIVNMDASDGPGKLPPDHLTTLTPKIEGMYRSLKDSEEIEILSMFCHPTTYATEEFWDIVNFAKGKNSPKEKYVKLRVKSREQTALDLQRLEEFVEYLASLPGAHFITASDALEIYIDKARDHEFTFDELSKLCEKSKTSITFQTIGGVWVSAAESLSMIVLALAEYARSQQLPKFVRAAHPLGPKEKYPAPKDRTFSLEVASLLDACVALASRLHEPMYYLPSSVELAGNGKLSVEDFFATCCELYLTIAQGHPPAARISVQTGNFEVGKYVTDEGARKDWAGTGTNPEGFSAPRQVELARLQTWTLKPAVADPTRIPKKN